MTRPYNRLTETLYADIVLWYTTPKAQREIPTQAEYARSIGLSLNRLEQIITQRIRPELGL